MASNSKRNTRTRRLPAHLVSDVKVLLHKNSDPECYGYARTSYTKDFVSPAQELNSLAKVLSKFINSANKRLLEKSNYDQAKEQRATKKGPQILDEEAKKSALVPDGAKRRANPKSEMKDNNARGSKQVPEYKDQQQSQIASKDKIKGQEAQKREVSSNKLSKQPNPKIYGQGTSSMHIGQEFNQTKAGMSIGLNKGSMDPITLALEQQQEILNYNPQLREKLQAQNHLQSRNHQGQKYFRRSAYHIAIAYQIHLNNLRESGHTLKDSSALDPTYQAKKLKGEFDKNNK